MRLPANLPISPTMLLIVAGVIALIFIAIGLLGRRSGDGTSNARNVDDRLNQFAGRAQRNQQAEPKPMAKIDAALSKGRQGSKIARDLARADLKLTVAEFVGLKILSALAGVGLGVFVGRASIAAMVLSGLVAGVLLSFAPNLYVVYASRKRIRAFNNQLGDGITLMANSLRSGYSFLQSMDLVSREAPPPMSSEFRRVVQEIGLGLSTEEALANLLRRVPSDDLDLLITAVNIQHEVGGNLAQILETIGHTIRERVRIKGEIQVLTAQGRISAYVITALPIVLAVGITVINPDYMSPMFKFGLPPDAWCCLPVSALVMIVVGFFVIMKIVDIEV
ncbi:MAG TPA: type II secretion system F family protein [Kouleothrix sp.]|uniref:type II secretion system F family protein n=1 Tax=Kouleothrix sp. TaxID=2779161 RepID=UPI002BF8F9EC|nr:type II secretion system F family protein [Kouleothrix sp.]HRC74040.1 type II secretion system F family protein [Kouleothrix sp.]